MNQIGMFQRQSLHCDVHHPWREEAEPFLLRANSVQVGNLTMSKGLHPPIPMGTAPISMATVVIVLEGSARFQAAGQAFALDAPQGLLYLPGHTFEVSTGDGLGVVIQLDSDRLAQTAATMSGSHTAGSRIRQRLADPILLQPRCGVEVDVLQTLRRAFQLLDAPALDLDGSLSLLAVDDLIYRTLTLTLCRDLITTPAPAVSERLSIKAKIIDELLVWIVNHLDQPISLADLEERSFYSERTLRTIFQQRFDCGPSEWIRQQRLEAIHRRLLNPQPGDTVSSIARAFAYRHLSQFSRDCHSAFGIPPSALLRQARQETADHCKRETAALAAPA